MVGQLISSSWRTDENAKNWISSKNSNKKTKQTQNNTPLRNKEDIQ